MFETGGKKPPRFFEMYGKISEKNGGRKRETIRDERDL